TEGSTVEPDGYTITMNPVELSTLHHLGQTDLSYEDVKPILQVNTDPASIAVREDSEFDTLEELVEYAKEHPGELKIGNSGAGSVWHLAAAAVESGTGAEFEHVPYDGGDPATKDLLGGHIDVIAIDVPQIKSQVEAGEIKSLALLNDERSEYLPDVPTV